MLYYEKYLLYKTVIIFTSILCVLYYFSFSTYVHFDKYR